jgi:hypothetical protein
VALNKSLQEKVPVNKVGRVVGGRIYDCREIMMGGRNQETEYALSKNGEQRV